MKVDGKPSAEHGSPMHGVGALVEACGIHTGRAGRNHLHVLAASAGGPSSRVDAAPDMVGRGRTGRSPASSRW